MNVTFGYRFLMVINRKKLTIIFCLGESLPPSAPEVVDGNERQMTIKWKAPIDDGGRPITGSQIKRKIGTMYIGTDR